jgi:hypothetical protein
MDIARVLGSHFFLGLVLASLLLAVDRLALRLLPQRQGQLRLVERLL